MQNFLKIAEGIDTIPALNALAVHENLWDENELRTTHPGTPHEQVSDIWMLFNHVPDTVEEVVNDIQTHPYRAWLELPQIAGMAMDLMRRVGGIQLGRVLVTRLRPGCRITPHIDEGSPATFYTRYQIALQSLPGAIFRAGDETVNFRSGEAWWFNNRVEHEVVNNSADDRVVLIVDVRIP